jgi:uncharacterized protein
MSAIAEREQVAVMIRDLEDRIRGYGDRALVAFSGGVDSSVVLALAARALGPDRVEAVTAISPSYPAGEIRVAAETASDLGVAHRSVWTHEVEREAYARNDELRCYHCKAELYGVLGRLVRTAIPDTVVLAGANADDLDEFRPGIWAGERAGIRNPLLEASVGKGTVRSIARTLGLRVSDKPALACLSSRVELGIRISPELLARVDEAEAIVRALGFEVVRVRHRGASATVEVPAGEVDRLLAHPGRDAALRALAALGWDEVAVDPNGYRPGGATPPPSGT